ncbi:hypothetical protein BgiBS90_035838, partial [Biomphalaria glabrata]
HTPRIFCSAPSQHDNDPGIHLALPSTKGSTSAKVAGVVIRTPEVRETASTS